jgi:hypothetical protein
MKLLLLIPLYEQRIKIRCYKIQPRLRLCTKSIVLSFRKTTSLHYSIQIFSATIKSRRLMQILKPGVKTPGNSRPVAVSQMHSPLPP